MDLMSQLDLTFELKTEKYHFLSALFLDLVMEFSPKKDFVMVRSTHDLCVVKRCEMQCVLKRRGAIC